MTLLAGLDLNATRVQALCGAPTATPHPLTLDDQTGPELPLALSLENRRPAVGKAGLELRRRLPHLACVNFLGQLGSDRQWTAGRHRLDAVAALGLVFKQLQPAFKEVKNIALVLPAYLGQPQIKLLTAAAAQAKLPIQNWISAPLAAVWAAREQKAWSGAALVLDVDDHALTWTAVAIDEPPAAPQARVLGTQTVVSLGRVHWKERLLNAIADRCIRHSRRDPRAFGDTEQALYDQLEDTFLACQKGEMQTLVIQSERWYQELVVQPGEVKYRHCGELADRTLTSLRELLATTQPLGEPLVVATASAALLPGVLEAFTTRVAPQTVVTLAADALARAAHEIAVRWHDGSLAKGPFDVAIPLKKGPKSKVQSPKSLFRGANRLRGDE